MKIKGLSFIWSVFLVGCAGSPVAIVNSEGARSLEVSGDTIYVVLKDGIWAASFEDYMAKQVYVNPQMLMRRKMQLSQAVARVSGCPVSDSTLDPMGITLHATASCSTAQPPSSAATAPTPNALQGCRWIDGTTYKC